MLPGLAARMLREVKLRCLWRFAYNFGWKNFRAIERFKRAQARGESGVPFLMISLTDRCNLRCAGCWVSPEAEGRELSFAEVDALIGEWKKRGVFFFGLLGGEPLLSPVLFDIIEKHSDCYFQLFTNGLLLDGGIAQRLARAGNVTPLLSIEGLEEESDRRRGGHGVYAGARAALAACAGAGLVTGVATSVCATNYDELVREEFVREVIRGGAHYLWYYIYRPVGPQPCPERALTRAQIAGLRRFMVDIRPRVPLVIIDAYWDHEGNALCPAAVGISHHIGPGGDLEGCPPLQFSCGHISAGAQALLDAPELAELKQFLREQSRGCILLDNPAALAEFVRGHNLRDTTGRDALLAELERMRILPDHDMGEERIPERHWFYRLAKKNWFFGFGAYG